MVKKLSKEKLRALKRKQERRAQDEASASNSNDGPTPRGDPAPSAAPDDGSSGSAGVGRARPPAPPGQPPPPADPPPAQPPREGNPAKAEAVAVLRPAEAEAAADEASSQPSPPADVRPGGGEYDVDLNDDHCYTCREGGELVLCSNCSLSFHLHCHRPSLDVVPEGKWHCSVCKSKRSVPTRREDQRAARNDVAEMERLHPKTTSPEKRAAEGESAATPDPKKQRGSVGEDASQFVEAFFALEVETQRDCLQKLVTDRRAANVLPPVAASIVSPRTSSPSTSHLRYNNEVHALSDPNKYAPLDDTAFHWYPPNIRGGVHRSENPENQHSKFNIVNAASQACLHFATQIKDFVMGLKLTDEQRRGALWKSFALGGMREMVQSFGLTTESTNIGLFIATNVSNFLQRARETRKQKGRVADAQRAAVNTLLAGIVRTPERQRDGTLRQPDGAIPGRSLLKALGVPTGSNRLLGKAMENRLAAKEKSEGAYDFLGQRKSWTKVPREVIDRLRCIWIPNCKFIKEVPSKNETVFVRDVNGKIVRDDNNEPIIVQTVVCRHRPREVHNLMILPENEGGFDGATDQNGTVLISESKLRRTWPNWVKWMTKRYKEMCACVKCGVSHGMQESLDRRRRKILKKLTDTIEAMREGRRKNERTQQLNKYKEEILDDEGELKITRASEAAAAITCPPLTINGITLPRFACANGDCPECSGNYKPNEFEASCDDVIKYVLYNPVHRCTWHGECFLESEEVDGKTKRWCTKCEDMSEEEVEEKQKTKKPAKIGTKKYRTLYAIPMSEFVKEGGEYHKMLKMYRLHRWHRIFLGNDVALKMFRELAVNNPGRYLLTNRDHSEKYQPAPDGEFQAEHFAKHQSLSMEGCAAWYRNEKTGRDQLTFYSHLSDEKRQDAGTVAENIRQMLFDLCFEKQELSLSQLKVLISIVDGCAEQYRSGSVCYELCHLAREFGIVYDRIIQAPSHGKCIVDSQNGLDKTLLDMFFNCLVAHPEELEDGAKMVLTHTRDEEGALVSLAKVCYDILNDPDRTQGSKSHANRAKSRKIDERRYIVREEGKASGEGVKFDCKDKGIMSCYNIRADPALIKERDKPFRIAMRRFPCCCAGCLAKLAEPIETRYSGPSDTCIYWEFFKKADGKSGYNNWRVVEIVPKKKVSKEEDILARKAVTVRGIGRTMASQVRVGAYGAYPVKDDRYDYYLVKWTGEPWEAKENKVMKLGEETFNIQKGEWWCRGIWLDTVPGSRVWWHETALECVVRMQTVVDASVDLVAISAENPLPQNMHNKTFAQENNAMSISNEMHSLLIEEALQRAAFDHTEYFEAPDGSDEEGSEDDEEDEYAEMEE